MGWWKNLKPGDFVKVKANKGKTDTYDIFDTKILARYDDHRKGETNLPWGSD